MGDIVEKRKVAFRELDAWAIIPAGELFSQIIKVICDM